MRYINFHKHTMYSNLRSLDCISKPEDYMKRAVELGHKEYVTTEHGFQGNIYEAYTLCQKYGLRCVYGVEAYYVDDMYDKSSRANYHLMLVALTERARKEINKIMSVANTDGFYYKPRIDLKCLLSLTPTDTIVTTACIASRMFKKGWEENFFVPVYKHFGDNFYLEVQNHNEPIQIEHNKRILQVKEKYGVQLIHANDSHYIHQEDAQYRDMFLRAKGIVYEDESNFILDYPDYDTIVQRYKLQGVLNDEQIKEALDNTLVIDNAEGITLDKEFKIPKVTRGDSNKTLRKIIREAWNEEKKRIPQDRIKEYKDAIYYETKIVEDCGMADYFILDHEIVKKAVNEYGAILTRSGRGSSVSFYINHLLGLTEVDRLASPITLYPTRFMSAERILSSRSLPDIDLNFADVRPVIQASKDILGEDGIYYMVAYKPLQESSAFRLWCKSLGMNINEYDDIAKNIENYEDNSKWGKIIEDSKIFRGVIESVAPSPCSFLLLDKPISEEVGLIKVGDEICCALDGYNCDVYKYLKNDYLTVSVYLIISKVYELIGRPIDDINTLLSNCDDKVWDIYAKGLTTTINQCDSDIGKNMLKQYKPRSLAEVSAWVAAIRPGFASLLNNFLERKPYTTGVDSLDEILQDSFHYLLYQESIMRYLIWLGIEEKGTYDIIKKIAKKKFTPEEQEALHKQLEDGWVKKLGTKDGFAQTWQVVQDAARYSFNASHSLSVAIDSLYGAYLKSHYPLEYYTVVLSLYSGDRGRTPKLIAELPYFGINLESIHFGKSGPDYTMDKQTNSIYRGIASVKYCNSQIADELLELSKNHYDSFIDLLYDIDAKTTVNSRQLEILTKLNFFSDFGKNKRLLRVIEIYDKFANAKIISKKKMDELGVTEFMMKKYAGKETKSQYRELDNCGLMKEMCNRIDDVSMNVVEQVKAEVEYLGSCSYTNPAMKDNYWIVTAFDDSRNATRPYVTIRRISNGEEINTRIKRSAVFEHNPFGLFSILSMDTIVYEFKKKKTEDGKWVDSDVQEPILANYEVIKREV